MSSEVGGHTPEGSRSKRTGGRSRKAHGDHPPTQEVEGIPPDAKMEKILLVDIDFEDTELEFRLVPNFKDLVEDIGRNGQQVPVVLRPALAEGMYQIVCGFRRCRAIRELGWPSVKAIVRRDLDDDAAFRISFLENARRRSLTTLDTAHAVCRLRLKGKTDEEIMAIYGMSQRSLDRSTHLSTIPEILKEAVHQGRVHASHCLLLMKYYTGLSGQFDLAAWIEKIDAEKLSTRDLGRALAAAFKNRARPKTRVEIRSDGGFLIRAMAFDPKRTTTEDKFHMRERLLEVLKLLE